MPTELVVRVNAATDISRLTLSSYCRPTTAKTHAPANGSSQSICVGPIYEKVPLTLHKPAPVQSVIVSTAYLCTSMFNETRTDILALPMTIAPPFSSYACQFTPACLGQINILHQPVVRFLLAWRGAMQKNRQLYPCPLPDRYQCYPYLC